MSERTSYEPGTPPGSTWASPTSEASVDFYGGLFGWDVPESENAEQTGGYRQAMMGGKPVAGMMPLMQEGQPPAWTTYVSVEDADATAAKVKRGRRHRDRRADGRDGPRPDGDLRRPDRRRVRDLAAGHLHRRRSSSTSPARFSWNELNTRDPEAAKAFYGAVFGWGFEDSDDGGDGHLHRVIKVGEDSVGGMIDISRPRPRRDPAPTGSSTSRSTTSTRTVATGKETGGSVALRARSTSRRRPLRHPQRPARGRFRGDDADRGDCRRAVRR